MSVVEWLATRNPKLFVMVSNQISRLFVTHFFFNSALFSFFGFLSLSRFFFFSFLYLSALFLLHFFYSFQVYFKFSMQNIRNESQTSPSLVVSVFELRICFISFNVVPI